jgi:hypothetical protein
MSHTAVISNLNDVDATGASQGQLLVYNSGQFEDDDTLTVDVSNGRLGINASSPAGTLHVSDLTQNHGIVLSKEDTRSSFFLWQNDGATAFQMSLTSTEDMYIRNYTQDRDIAFQINDGGVNTTILSLDGSASRVGILTVAPSATLDVRGSATFNEDGDSVDFRVESNTLANAFFVDGSADAVGINTSSPAALLHIAGTGNTTATSAFRVYNSSNNITLWVRDDEMVYINAGSGSTDNNTSALSVNENANYTVSSTNDNFHIGLQLKSGAGHVHHKIGVMHPQNGLGSKIGGDLSIEAGSVRSDTTNKVDGGNLYLRAGRAGRSTTQGSSNIYLQTSEDTGVSGRQSWLTAMTIDNSQNVGIGTASAGESLDVNGNARFRSIGSGSSAGALHYTSNGTLTTNTSDKRLKDNICDIRGALKTVKKLRGVSFEWKDDKALGTQFGFIAQEVAKVIPEATFTNKVDGMMGIHYNEIIPYLVEAIKEQQNHITFLKGEITKLKNNG